MIKYRITHIVLLLFLFAILVIPIYCYHFGASWFFSEGDFDFINPISPNTPQEMFQHTIQNPIPASVTNLQGIGGTWQGYSLYLRFNASKADIDTVIAQGFKPATWASISYRFNLPASYDRFTPDWDPASIGTKECYELSDVKNGWTHSGTHYLVIDHSTGTVYFYGISRNWGRIKGVRHLFLHQLVHNPLRPRHPCALLSSAFLVTHKFLFFIMDECLPDLLQ